MVPSAAGQDSLLVTSAPVFGTHQREPLLAAIAEAAQRLLKAKYLDAALPEILGLLGEAAKMDRLLLLLETTSDSGQAIHRVKAEWTASGVPSHKELGLSDLRDADFAQLAAKLRAGESYWLHADDVVGEGRQLFRRLGIVTTTGYPIFVEGNYLGLLAFDDCRKWRPFNLSESEALRTVAALVASVLHRHSLIDTIARVRETASRQRAIQLEAANKAMWRSSEMIAAAENETAVLGAMLSQAVEATGASGAAVMRRALPGNKRLLLAALSQDGVALDVASLATLPCVLELESLSRTDPVGYFQGLFEGHVNYRQCDETLQSWAPESAAYHARFGHRIVWDYPFWDRAEVGGWISLAFKDCRSLDDTTLQVLSTLTIHVSLALKRSRLSLVAKEAAVAQERNRLAGEIHDSLAQSFAGIAMQLEAAEYAGECGEVPVALSSARRARELARFGLAEARRSVLALRPVTALAGGIEAALTSLAERSCVEGLMNCSFAALGQRRLLVDDCNLNLFRIAQEAVSNAARHGRPSTIDISLEFDADTVTLRVADDGVGADLTRIDDPSGGLAAIRQRADHLGAQLVIESWPGTGTVLSVALKFLECQP